MGKPALVDIALMADALRDIGGILGIPSTVDVLLHLPDLVERVRGLAERAAGIRAQLIDVTRTNTQLRAQEQAITDNVDAWIADAVAAERHAEIERLTVERDRRIDPAEHGRAVMEAWKGVVDDPPYWPSLDEGWRVSDDRAALLARVGPDVLAEVER